MIYEQFLYSIFIVVMGIMAITDYRKQEINLFIPGILFFAGFITNILLERKSLMSLGIGSLVGIFLLILAYVSREAIGYGDGFVLTSSGAFLGGIGNLMLLMISLMLSGLLSLILLVVKRRKKAERIPFVPFVLGAFILMLATGIGEI